MRLQGLIASLLQTIHSQYAGPFAESLEILILQPTPFCNINCDYCYLPNRNDTHRMSVETIKAAIQTVFDAGLIKEQLSVVWHAGEPLILPVAYYELAFAAVHDLVKESCEISHSFQTNGTLINDEWCKLFQRPPVRIGLSIDGPEFLHDRHRKTRSGRGTHAQIMRGVQCLREHEIPFHVIAVISEDSLNHADAIFEFFVEQASTILDLILKK